MWVGGWMSNLNMVDREGSLSAFLSDTDIQTATTGFMLPSYSLLREFNRGRTIPTFHSHLFILQALGYYTNSLLVEIPVVTSCSQDLSLHLPALSNFVILNFTTIVFCPIVWDAEINQSLPFSCLSWCLFQTNGFLLFDILSKRQTVGPWEATSKHHGLISRQLKNQRKEK